VFCDELIATSLGGSKYSKHSTTKTPRTRRFHKGFLGVLGDLVVRRSFFL